MVAAKNAERIPGYCALCTSSCGCVSVVEDGANVNAVIGNRETDPISGSVPHRSYLCEITRIAGAA